MLYQADLVRRWGEAGSEKSCGSGPFVLWEVVGAGPCMYATLSVSPGRLLGSRMDRNRTTLRTRSFVRVGAEDTGGRLRTRRGFRRWRIESTCPRHQTTAGSLFDCCCDSDLPSPGRSISTLCVSSCGDGLFFCDPGLAWLCQPATAPLTANEYDAVTLDTTRHD